MIITLTKWSDFWVACWDLKKKNTATAGGGLKYAAIQKRRWLVYFCFFLLAHWILFRALPWVINMGCGLVWSGGICVFQKRHPASRPGHYCTRLHRTLFFYILYFLCKIHFLCHLFPLFVYARSLRKTFLDLKYFLCQNTLFNSTSPKFITLTVCIELGMKYSTRYVLESAGQGITTHPGRIMAMCNKDIILSPWTQIKKRLPDLRKRNTILPIAQEWRRQLSRWNTPGDRWLWLERHV